MSVMHSILYAKIQDSRFKIQDSKFKIQDSNSRLSFGWHGSINLFIVKIFFVLSVT